MIKKMEWEGKYLCFIELVITSYLERQIKLLKDHITTFKWNEKSQPIEGLKYCPWKQMEVNHTYGDKGKSQL